MRTRHFFAIALLLIAAAAVGSHFVSCAEEDVSGGEIYLGDLDGYSESEIVAKLDAYCSTRHCDGEIPISTPLGARELSDYDDDLEALLYFLYGILPLPIDLSVLLESAADYHPVELSDDMEMLGPFRATINLNEACAPGTGSVTVVFTEVLGRKEEDTGSARQALSDLYIALVMISYYIEMSECRLFGMTMEAKPPTARAEVASIRAGILAMKPDTGEPPVVQQGTGADQGSGTVNKPAGGKKADEPYTIWGIDQPIASDLQFLYDPSDPTAPYVGTGGVCYGGTTATTEGCEGIFVPAADVATLILPTAPLP